MFVVKCWTERNRQRNEKSRMLYYWCINFESWKSKKKKKKVILKKKKKKKVILKEREKRWRSK